GGQKSGILGIDLEFTRDDIRYLVAIKSGPNWGNSDQIRKMVANFQAAKRTLSTSGAKQRIECVNGCCYGKSSTEMKKEGYYKYCGQRFWEFISGNNDLYLEIIEPLGKKTKKRNEAYQKLYDGVLNVLSSQFIQEFCDSKGNIKWDSVVRLNSEHNK
ncbi:MAG: PmeII family type II restriction endonuclease, partial [Candidatus Cloacimonadaceae bacterium]